METKICEMLKSTGLEVFYYHAQNVKDLKLPFIVYFCSSSKSYGSDFLNEIKSEDYVVELYSSIKDIKNEKKIEEVFNSEGIEFEKNVTFLKEENFFMSTFNFQITFKI